MGFVASRLIVK